MTAPENQKRPPRTVETTITDLAFDGRSVGNIDGKITFFDAGLPGETVRGVVTRKKANYNFAHVTEIVSRSPERVPARCVHFDICGGCTWQDLDYSRQLYYKRQQVIDCLKHIGHLDNLDIAEIVGCDEQFFYRNKMEFSFHTEEGSDFTFGLHHRGHFDRIFDVTECHLQSPESNRIVGWFRQFVKEHNIPVYNVWGHTGLIRFLAIREGKRTGQIMLNIVTADGTLPDQAEMVDSIREHFPAVVTIIQNINSAKANIAKGDTELTLYGPGYIEENILGYTFRIYANSFFQTNTVQVEKLYRIIYETLAPGADDRLLDLYCGAGTIGIGASRLVHDVIGIELEPSATRAAAENARLNGLDNIVFHTGSVQEMLLQQPEIFADISCAVVDPPRAGMHPKALKKLAELKLPRFVYVSCNPGTFARDAAFLVQEGYKIDKITPVDMFPHTMHIELVAGLSR